MLSVRKREAENVLDTINCVRTEERGRACVDSMNAVRTEERGRE